MTTSRARRTGPPIPPDSIGCALCRHTLETVEINGVIEASHGHGIPAHPPIAVPLRQILAPRLRCDHCSNPNPVWSYQTAPIHTLAVGDNTQQVQTLGDRFATCQPCATLIENGDRAGLLRRVIAAYADQSGTAPDAFTRDALTALHHAFWRSRRPGRDRLPTTTPTAAPAIRAGIVPKVRDRLAAWWRSSAPQQTFATTGGQPSPISATAPHGGIMADSLDQAALLWIDAAFTSLARHAARELPALSIDPQQIPAEHGLLIWAEPDNPQATPPQPDPAATDTEAVAAAHWTRIPGGWWVCFYTATGASLSEPALHAVRRHVGWLHPTGAGVFLPEAGDTEPTSCDDGLAVLIATWALASQTVASTGTDVAERSIRRAYARTGRPDPQIRIIRLRPRPPAPPTPGPGSPTGRVYDHQWWVRGFWRQQPYGRNRALRRPVYIEAHTAGPHDKPLRLTPTVRVLGSTRTPPAPTHR